MITGKTLPRVLIVDDELAVRRLLHTILDEGRFDVTEASNVAQAERALAAGEVDVVVTDHQMPDGDGLAVLEAARDADPSIPVVFLTGVATVQLAVDAMKAGAFDLVTKPFQSEQVQAVVARAAERYRLLRENESLRGQVRRLFPGAPLVGPSAPMEDLRRLILRIARTDATVLVVGETGTGKELVARAIHAASARSDRLFLPVNCAGFSETLLESELFGHERGSFTGADRTRPGVFEAAHGGTLFLDEAGEMSLPLQAKLLRVLVTGEVVRVGSAKPRHADVRIVVATHRDLKQRVREGAFREDLYYRLAVVPIRVPPLRERREDVPALAEDLLLQIARELKLPAVPVPTDAALERLSGYDFPGNVRELRNVLEQSAILSGNGRIDATDLMLPASSGSGSNASGHPLDDWIASLPDSFDLRSLQDDVERRIVQRALAGSAGVAAHAARKLGLSRSDLSYKLRRLGISRDQN